MACGFQEENFGVFVKPTRRWVVSIPRGRFPWYTLYLQVKAVPLLWSYLFSQTVSWWDLCYCIAIVYHFFGGCEITCPACHNRRKKNQTENRFLQQSKRKAKSDLSKKHICNSLANLNREKMIDRQCTNSSCNKLQSSYWFLQPLPKCCILHSQVANYSLPMLFSSSSSAK